MTGRKKKKSVKSAQNVRFKPDPVFLSGRFCVKRNIVKSSRASGRDSCVLFKPYLTDGVKCLQAASQMIKTAAGFLREALPGSAGWTTGELLFI